MNMILNTDSYKLSMFNQYPPGTTSVYSYVESRGGEYSETVFFGLQAFLIEYLSKPITREDIEEAAEIFALHGTPFYREGWEYILSKYNGYLPLVIRAVPEGTVVPVKNVLAVVENTDPNCFWLTTYVETALLRAIWYPTTVATQSYTIKKLIKEYLELTGDVSGLPFKLHDFGARGVSSEESAAIGGAAHLVNFMGTDTISALSFLRKFYGAEMAGFSIPAMEHSTVTSWGQSRESAAYANMLDNYAKPGAILACVSDSYDVYHAAEKIWGEELLDRVKNSGATVVVRPDSGDPVEVNLRLMQILLEKFGYETNDKGFKVLNNVRLIQGDGINYNTIKAILEAFYASGYSADNIAFGMGGALLQQVNRDTQRFAMKCSSIVANGEIISVKKSPATDPGKGSKAGRVTLYKDEEGYFSGVEDWKGDELNMVFLNGTVVKTYTLEEIRKNSEK